MNTRTICLTAILAAAFASISGAAPVSVVVTPDNLQGWTTQISGATGSITFVNGSSTIGNGSMVMSVGASGGDVVAFRTPLYGSLKLAKITTLKMDTRVTNFGSSTPKGLAMQIDVDWNNDGVADDQLFYEPIYSNNTFNQTPVLNTWQTWDILNNGTWYSVGGYAGMGQATPKKLSQYISNYPDARITAGGLGHLRIFAGYSAGYWDNFTAAIDNLQIGALDFLQIYDFEPSQTTSLGITVDPGLGYIGALNGIQLNYNLSGPQSYTGSLTLDASGKSQISGVVPGTYSLSLTGSHWTTRIIKDINVNGTTSINTTLTNGDSDGNSQINLFDFVVLDSKFGSSDAMADLNGDGMVNLFDYVLIDQNFGAQGD
ncbi:MAG: hypothetical protein ACYC1M_12845 [Armatimonadota bacterium]